MSFEAASNNFVQWLQRSGVAISESVVVSDLRSENQGRGLVATAPISENELLFLIPRTVVFSLSNCSFKADHPEKHNELYELGQWEALMVVLAYELRKPDSQWRPYFEVLPIRGEIEKSSNQLMFWTDSEIETLKPSLVVERIGKDATDKLYQDLFDGLVMSWDIPEFRSFTKKDFYEVGAIIMSYSFDVEEDEQNEEEDHEEEEDSNEDEEEEGEDHYVGEDEHDVGEEEHASGDEKVEELIANPVSNDSYLKSMVPLADTLNADTHLHNASLSYEGSMLVMKATKAIKKGDQIYNTYSNHPNSEILRRYGYVEYDSSAYDFGEVPLSTVKEYFNKQLKSKPPLDTLLEILSTIHDDEQQDDDEEPTDLIVESYDCYSNQEVIMELTFLIQILTILVAINKDTPFRKMTKTEVHSTIKRCYHKCYQLIESHKLTKDYLKNYKAILEQRIAQYPQEEAVEVDRGLNRSQMARVVLHSERQSLRKCLDTDVVYKDYELIDDGKLIRNINKRAMQAKETQSSKRKKVEKK
ncbi:uncharacterized protein KQ657_000807 [Scheffersomyces spartinae]|uniref:Ribosomal lysine N-methyltransferase 4 n=1 Tax=Scheffersomyces spartinae TaxID=45513 RepID=A0A9P7V8X6_9ASCO|nr:uncharacterized protein KQ657_000807 [Scheffersomyces spartinae]KAG7193389.1 hypothetical protein KQ657_000807 [Scheffersomyces spartinae]